MVEGSPSDPIARLEHHDGAPCPDQLPGGAQAGQPGADHRDVDRPRRAAARLGTLAAGQAGAGEPRGGRARGRQRREPAPAQSLLLGCRSVLGQEQRIVCPRFARRVGGALRGGRSTSRLPAMDLGKIATRAVEAALSAGAGDAEAYVQDSVGREIRIFEGEVESLTEAGERGLGVRCWIDHRVRLRVRDRAERRGRRGDRPGRGRVGADRRPRRVRGARRRRTAPRTRRTSRGSATRRSPSGRRSARSSSPRRSSGRRARPTSA